MGIFKVIPNMEFRFCRYKCYEVWACLPEHGTVVMNELTSPATVNMFGGKTYFTPAEAAECAEKTALLHTVWCSGGD